MIGCVNCTTPAPLVNLVSGTCPPCHYAIAQWQAKHQVLAEPKPLTVGAVAGLVVKDVLPGNAGRLIARLARRRRVA